MSMKRVTPLTLGQCREAYEGGGKDTPCFDCGRPTKYATSLAICDGCGLLVCDLCWGRGDHRSIVGRCNIIAMRPEIDLSEPIKAPTLADTIEVMESRLDEQSDDWATRAMLADAYDDAGDAQMAEAMRWMAEKGKHPEKMTKYYEWWPDSEGFDFADASSRLPLNTEQMLRLKLWRDFATRRDAERALAKVIKQVKAITGDK